VFTSLQIDKQTDRRLENIMPPPASLAWPGGGIKTRLLNY